MALRPEGDGDPRHSFQLRFFLSACLLALTVAILSLPIAIATAPPVSVYIICGFAVALLLQMGAVRLGFPVWLMVWTILGTVTIFLILIMLTAPTLDPAQLPWFILLPLGARAFTVPRVEDAEAPPTARVTLIATAIAMLAVLLVVFLHAGDINFGQPRLPDPSWAIAANYVLFLFSALGLVLLYDYTAQLSLAELQRVRSLLSICAWCRKIRSEDEWISLEEYTTIHTGAELSHGICQTCSDAEFQRLSTVRPRSRH